MKQYGQLFIENLCTIDLAIFDSQLGIMGRSYEVDIRIKGQLDDNGFIYDFSHLKKLCRNTLKESVDHALLLPINSRRVSYQELENKHECWKLSSGSGEDICEWEYHCPKGAVFPIRSANIRSATVALEIERLIRHRLPVDIDDIQVKLRKESSEPTEAFFCYTHGITGHDGLCQRLFHGHRSRIEVYVGEERRPDLEHFVTRELFGGQVHVAAMNQIRNKDGIVPRQRQTQLSSPIEIEYEAKHGRFFASIPAERVFVVESHTSIECIANELALCIAEKASTSQVVYVKVFEGIGKGALAQS
jgi:6-pyruvoyl-tetrahydropterin synthase